VWETFVINPMINLLLLFYRFLGQQTIVAIAVLTLMVRLLVLPLTLKQQKSVQRLQELQPELENLKKKYAKDPEKLSQEQLKIYQKAGVNPLGGCLPTLLQFPILIGLWQSIVRVLAVSPLDLLKLSQNVWSFIPNLSNLIPLDSTFLWLDLGQPDRFFILPVLVVVTSWLSQKISTPPSTDSNSAAMTQQMQIMMPLMFGMISISYASGLSIYFVISNLITLITQYFVKRGKK
jgi:YidC/Oxa1 family membrane protein insertase